MDYVVFDFAHARVWPLTFRWRKNSRKKWRRPVTIHIRTSKEITTMGTTKATTKTKRDRNRPSGCSCRTRNCSEDTRSLFPNSDPTHLTVTVNKVQTRTVLYFNNTWYNFICGEVPESPLIHPCVMRTLVQSRHIRNIHRSFSLSDISVVYFSLLLLFFLPWFFMILIISHVNLSSCILLDVKFVSRPIKYVVDTICSYNFVIYP